MEKKLPRKIVISADPYEARAALLDGDLLINLEIESAGSNRKKGNIYKGRVTTVEKSLDAAFVDYGTGKDGFLPLDEVNERSLVELTGKSPGANGHVSLGVGDIILVQVAKEEVGKKGAALTMNVSNPGRFLVLMPFSSRTGVSRRLSGDDRSRLKVALDRLTLPEGFGCIIRTVSDQSMESELQADLDHLLRQWRDITSRFKELKKPGELHTESSLALRFIRDYMDTGVEDVIVEDDVTWRELNQYFASVMPGVVSVLTRYSGDLPLFVRFNVDRQVEALLKNKVSLPSGGSIVIGQTEALTAIDVNSGRTRKGAIEETAYKTNLEAAVEIARQVILRDIGGIIVVDFIDMESESHRKGVEDALRNALARDKAHLTVARIRDFGLLAFSRQRLRHTVEEGIMSACPACGGTGRIRAPGPLAMSIMRRLRERLANMTGEAELVEVTVSVDVANFLNNRKRAELIGLEKKHGLTIEILGVADVAADDMQLRIHEDLPDDRQLSRARFEIHEENGAATQAATPDKPADNSVKQPAPPPKQKPSLLKGLIARLLDIEEFDEVSTRQKPQNKPSPQHQGADRQPASVQARPPVPNPDVQPSDDGRKQKTADRDRQRTEQKSSDQGQKPNNQEASGDKPRPSQRQRRRKPASRNSEQNSGQSATQNPGQSSGRNSGQKRPNDSQPDQGQKKSDNDREPQHRGSHAQPGTVEKQPAKEPTPVTTEQTDTASGNDQKATGDARAAARPDASNEQPKDPSKRSRSRRRPRNPRPPDQTTKQPVVQTNQKPSEPPASKPEKPVEQQAVKEPDQESKSSGQRRRRRPRKPAAKPQDNQ